MTRRYAFSLAFSLCLSGPALADAPRVVADIAPVHGLVALVMDGVGAPDLLLPPGQTPHGYAMRPSDARRLQNADVVFWVGEGLTPWLEKPLSSVADGALNVALIEVPGLELLEYEEDGHDDHHEDGHHDEDHGDDQAVHHDDDHADGHDEDHDDKHGDAHADDHGDEHGEDHADGHDHHHEGVDPHAWTDPEIAARWLTHIAGVLSEIDPDNAQTYRANADAGQKTLEDLSASIAAQLAPVKDTPFIAFHDAYRYFEHRFGLNNAGTVSAGDATDPGAAHLVELKAEMAEKGVTCGFSEPQFDPKLLKVLAEGANISIRQLDPLGVDLELGAQFYPVLLQSMADSLTGCLKP